jgi:hypothetical protein
MARYIDAEHLMQKLSRMIDFCEKHKVSGLNALFQMGDAIMDCPTADVAPKSEVAAVKIELEAMRTAANAYKMHYEKAKSEVEQFPCIAYNKKHERYQVIHKGKDGRIFASKLHHTRKDAEIALAELKKKYTEEKT